MATAQREQERVQKDGVLAALKALIVNPDVRKDMRERAKSASN